MCVCVCLCMYKCECGQAHVGGEGPGRGDRSQAGPKLAQGSLQLQQPTWKWRLGRPLAGQHRELWPMTRRVAGCKTAAK